MKPSKRPKQDIIEAALRKMVEMNPQQTDGKWLELVTVESGPYIREWDIVECWSWDDWPEREERFPGTTKLDVGIDAVAIRHNDRKCIAIQCKSRRLDEAGRGNSIGSGEIAKFAAASASDFWAERWVVTNGDNPLASGAAQAASMTEKPLKLVNITYDLHKQQQANDEFEDSPPPPNPTAMISDRLNPACRTKPSQSASAISGSRNSQKAVACRRARHEAESFCPAELARPASRSGSSKV